MKGIGSVKLAWAINEKDEPQWIFADTDEVGRWRVMFKRILRVEKHVKIGLNTLDSRNSYVITRATVDGSVLLGMWALDLKDLVVNLLLYLGRQGINVCRAMGRARVGFPPITLTYVEGGVCDESLVGPRGSWHIKLIELYYVARRLHRRLNGHLWHYDQVPQRSHPLTPFHALSRPLTPSQRAVLMLHGSARAPRRPSQAPMPTLAEIISDNEFSSEDSDDGL